MQDQTVKFNEESSRGKGPSSSKPPRKISGSHMPVSRRNICYLFPVAEDGEATTPIDVK